MKSFSSLFAFCLLISSFATAQVHFSYGVKAGAGTSKFLSGNRGNFTYLPSGGYTNTIGAYAGATASMAVGYVFFMQAELLYSLRGSHYAYQGKEGNFRYHSISVPVLLGFHPIKKLSLLIGPEFGYVTGATVSNWYKTNVKDGTSRYAIDVDLGVSFAITRRITIEGRYVAGLTYLEQLAPIGYTIPDAGPARSPGKEGRSLLTQFGLHYKLHP